MQEIKIAVVEDHVLVRECFVKELTADQEMEVVMQAKHGVDMLQQLERATVMPDVAVVDLSMPVMDGFTLSLELKNKYPAIRTLVLSAYCSEYNVALMIKNGICGYLLKDCSPAEFRKAIHSIYETGYYYSALASEHAFKILQNTNHKAITIPDSEMKFLKLCCTELRYDQIAKEMGITMKTLDSYRERLFSRLGVSSRIAVVLFAMQSGFANESVHPHNLKIKF